GAGGVERLPRPALVWSAGRWSSCAGLPNEMRTRHDRAMRTAEQIFDEARSAGIDLDLLDTNLALSVAQRWRQHDDALELALTLKAAWVTRDAELQADPRTAE
ncbi:MAG: hypothetical protein ABR538_03825, partial [Candidatus Binatia bacterium]